MRQGMESLDSQYDIVVIGGGVTGAGVFHRAVRMGLKALLVEAKDFAWGTSSRSSKMVHGGLRYLKQGKFLLTRAAVKERERLLSAYPGLVTPLDFMMPLYTDHGPSRRVMKSGLSIYSLMAGQRQHRLFDRRQTMETVRGVRSDGLQSAVGFRDAQVDDARLVLRLIIDACSLGGHALNYTRALSIDRDAKGRVAAVQISDVEKGTTAEIRTPVVINATGAFAEMFQKSPLKGFHIRPLRGSHMVFPGEILPLDRVLSFIHPADRRPVFLFPWEGCLFLGTTDVDHGENLELEPGITQAEIEYLLEGIRFILPQINWKPDMAIASIAGVRPVLGKKKKAASKESREHVVWKEKGLVTVTGGKLTTFELLAKDALKAASRYLPQGISSKIESPGIPATGGNIQEGDLNLRLRIQGRYGARCWQVAELLAVHGKERVGTTQTLWAELVHGARSEGVRHLSDLLLRRVRIGLFLPRGGMDQMDRIRELVSPHLGWSPERWETEIKSYQKLWEGAYSPAPGKRGG